MNIFHKVSKKYPFMAISVNNFTDNNHSARLTTDVVTELNSKPNYKEQYSTIKTFLRIFSNVLGLSLSLYPPFQKVKQSTLLTGASYNHLFSYPNTLTDFLPSFFAIVVKSTSYINHFLGGNTFTLTIIEHFHSTAKIRCLLV